MSHIFVHESIASVKASLVTIFKVLAKAKRESDSLNSTLAPPLSKGQKVVTNLIEWHSNFLIAGQFKPIQIRNKRKKLDTASIF